MITLYTFGPMFDLPDPSPFVTKGEMLLKLSGLEYKTDPRGFSRAPKGKLPYIEENGTIIADSTLIRLYLEKKHHIDFDRGLSVRDRGVAWAVEKMLEEQLYWPMVRWRWLDDANFAKGPKSFFRRDPKEFADDFTIEFVPDTGHFIGEERPELVNDRALEFFARD